MYEPEEIRRETALIGHVRLRVSQLGGAGIEVFCNLMEGSTNAPRPAGGQSANGKFDGRLRIVAAPGGAAFVADDADERRR